MRRRSIGAALLGLIAATAFALPAQAADPIRIGLGMARLERIRGLVAISETGAPIASRVRQNIGA